MVMWIIRLMGGALYTTVEVTMVMLWWFCLISHVVIKFSLSSESLEKSLLLYYPNSKHFETADGITHWKQLFERLEASVFFDDIEPEIVDIVVDVIKGCKFVLVKGTEPSIIGLRKADVLTQLDYKGRTMLHTVVGEDHKSIVILLWKLGVDMTARNSKGETALEFAKRIGAGAMVDLLWELRIGVGRGREED
jgi:hypothetical protein